MLVRWSVLQKAAWISGNGYEITVIKAILLKQAQNISTLVNIEDLVGSISRDTHTHVDLRTVVGDLERQTHVLQHVYYPQLACAADKSVVHEDDENHTACTSADVNAQICSSLDQMVGLQKRVKTLVPHPAELL